LVELDHTYQLQSVDLRDQAVGSKRPVPVSNGSTKKRRRIQATPMPASRKQPQQQQLREEELDSEEIGSSSDLDSDEHDATGFASDDGDDQDQEQQDLYYNATDDEEEDDEEEEEDVDDSGIGIDDDDDDDDDDEEEEELYFEPLSDSDQVDPSQFVNRTLLEQQPHLATVFGSPIVVDFANLQSNQRQRIDHRRVNQL
jgi:hypothetical protein